MKFWDASAILPLLVGQAATGPLRAIAASDTKPVVWWASEVECASALARLERENLLAGAAIDAAYGRLRELSENWDEVEPSEAVRETAGRLLRVHPLRAADALQLAAAFVGAGQQPGRLQFVTLDQRLAEAARKEGFILVDVAA